MARTPTWIKKLGGHAGELYVCAELSKRGIPNALLPENFSDEDVLVGKKDGNELGFVQVKSCHPDRSTSFILRDAHEAWVKAPDNQIVALVWLGSPAKNESPRFWLSTKAELGQACRNHAAHGTDNWERRFGVDTLPSEWEENWKIFERFRP